MRVDRCEAGDGTPGTLLPCPNGSSVITQPTYGSTARVSRLSAAIIDQSAQWTLPLLLLLRLLLLTLVATSG